MKLFIALVLLASTQAFLLKNNLEGKASFKPCSGKDGKHIKVNSLDVNNPKSGQHVVIKAKALKDFEMDTTFFTTNKNGKNIQSATDDFKIKVKSGGNINYDGPGDRTKNLGPGKYSTVLMFKNRNDVIDCIEYEWKI